MGKFVRIIESVLQSGEMITAPHSFIFSGPKFTQGLGLTPNFFNGFFQFSEIDGSKSGVHSIGFAELTAFTHEHPKAFHEL